MKKTIQAILTTIVLLPTAVMAGQYKTVNTNQSAIFKSDLVLSLEKAEVIGNNFIQELRGSDTFELSQRLPTPHIRIDKRSVELKGTELSIKEQLREDGTLGYYSEVAIDYKYSYKTEK